MKVCLAAVLCLIVAAFGPAVAGQEDWAEKVHAARISEQGGDFAGAERILLAVLKDARDFGPDDPRKGFVLHQLGDIYHSQGRFLEAETHYRNAIGVWKRVPGAEDLPLTQSMRGLAALYLETGQYTKAERLGLDSLAARLEATIAESGTTAVVSALAGLSGTLGALAFAQGKYGPAETCYRRALALWEKVAPNNRERMQVLIDLGTLYYQQARYTEARACYERGLTLAEALMPRDRLHEVKLLASLAAAMLKTEGTAEAIKFYKKALAIGESALGPEHPLVGEVLLNYAVALRLAKQKAEAKSCQRRAEAILKAGNRDTKTYSIDVADLRRSPKSGIHP